MEFYSKLLLTLFSRFEINTIRKYTFPSLFLIKLNSSSLEPTDEPFKSPDPLNFNSGALLVDISYRFLNCWTL